MVDRFRYSWPWATAMLLTGLAHLIATFLMLEGKDDCNTTWGYPNEASGIFVIVATVILIAGRVRRSEAERTATSRVATALTIVIWASIAVSAAMWLLDLPLYEASTLVGCVLDQS